MILMIVEVVFLLDAIVVFIVSIVEDVRLILEDFD
jgi:hypothetical protein